MLGIRIDVNKTVNFCQFHSVRFRVCIAPKQTPTRIQKNQINANPCGFGPGTSVANLDPLVRDTDPAPDPSVIKQK
jgi:hypothetical protein